MCLNSKTHIQKAVKDDNVHSEHLSVNKSTFNLVVGKYLSLFNDALFRIPVVIGWWKVIRNLLLLAVKRCNKPFSSPELSHSCGLGINATQLWSPAAL